MNILVIGSGAREHALCEAFYQSKTKPSLFCFGESMNPGIRRIAQKMEVGKILDFEHIRNFATSHAIDIAFVGPEAPLVAGIVDFLSAQGIRCIGPTKKLSRLEGSKGFTRKLLEKYEIEGNPKYQVFFETAGMKDFAHEAGEIVVKADGLEGGKGVQVQGDHFSTVSQGLTFAEECIAKSGKVVLEEKLVGQEFSLMFFTDGQSLAPMPVVQDNKRALSGDKGANTGGMGCVSDADHLLPFITADDVRQATEITAKTVGALQVECDETYIGILFGGFMVTANGVRLIEYNVRFGDPEALNLLPLLATDLVTVCESMLSGTLGKQDIEFYAQASVCKYLVPEGYPENPVTGQKITLTEDEIDDQVHIFYASVDEAGTDLILKGSRAVAFCAVADTLAEAQYLAESATKSVTGPVFHREDIGTGKLMRERTEMMNVIRRGQNPIL